MIKIERYTQYDATYFARVVKALLQYGKSFRLETHKTLELFVTSIVIIKVVNGTLGIVVFYDAKNVTEIYFKSPVHGMQLEVANYCKRFLITYFGKDILFLVAATESYKSDYLDEIDTNEDFTLLFIKDAEHH
jgi:hypothetical protein